jgi:hypothetical protein
LRATIGDDPDNWLPHRTQLLTFTLNLTKLVESGDLHPELLGLDAAVDEVGVHYESMVEDEALDLELMRMDGGRLASRGIGPRLDDQLQEWAQAMIISGRTHTDLYTDTVCALTRAVLQRNADGSACDFSDFLAHVLAATAANVRGPDCLIAGRPASWESSWVDGLVRGTMGDQPDDWAWLRTQPIVIRLNVAELVEDGLLHPGPMGLDEALERLGRWFESTVSDQDLDAWDSEIDTVTARYTTEYRLYADRFKIAARSIANNIPGLCADVYVETDTDRNTTWWWTRANNNPTKRRPIVLRARPGAPSTTSHHCPTLTWGRAQGRKRPTVPTSRCPVPAPPRARRRSTARRNSRSHQSCLRPAHRPFRRNRPCRIGPHESDQRIAFGSPL